MYYNISRAGLKRMDVRADGRVARRAGGDTTSPAGSGLPRGLWVVQAGIFLNALG